MLKYMKAFLAEEERRKQHGLPSQVPARTIEDPEVAATTEEEESSDEERPPKSAKKSSTLVDVTPHGTSVMPPNILRMITPV